MEPLFKKWVGLGEGKGISITLWQKNIQLQRQEKEEGKWATKQEINLAGTVLKELLWVLPKAIESIEIARQQK